MDSGLIYMTVEHDDWCLIWLTGDSSRCNCSPTVTPTVVTDENMDEVAKTAQVNEDRARRLIQSKKN